MTLTITSPHHYAECYLCSVSSFFVAKLSAAMLSVAMLSVVMLSVVAPFKRIKHFF
jgi:hypothetical protein